MRTFLVEQYLPELSATRIAALAGRLAAVTSELRRGGSEVQLLGLAGLPDDETLLGLFAAPRADVVAHAIERVEPTVDRIVPAFWHPGAGR